MTGGTSNIKDIWAATVDQVKQTVISPQLWRALEKTVAVIWEENNFVIGFSTMDGTAAGQLNATEYRQAIERILRDLTRNPDIRLRVLEGSTIEDWEYEKRRDAAFKQSQTQNLQKKAVEASTYSTWEEVYEQVSRLYANSEYRGLPSGRARYVESALTYLLQAMDTLYKNDEPSERGLSRIIERIAANAQTDAIMVGYLLFMRRKNNEVEVKE